VLRDALVEEATLKITDIETLPLSIGGAFPYAILVVLIRTDEGLTGIGEASLGGRGRGVLGVLDHARDLLVGQDPARIEHLWGELVHGTFWSTGQVIMSAVAGIDLALWDLKGKRLGVPVYELLGGLFRDRIPLYWSHFATYRAVWPEVVGQPPTHTYAEWAAGARDVVAQGYKVLKTNLIAEGGPDGKARLPRYLDGAIDHRTIDDAVAWIGTLRDVVGQGIGIAVDVQFDYRMGGIVKLARALEQFDLYWLEVESLDPEALLAAREQTTTRLCHGESLIRREQFRPFLQKHVTDVVMIETLSNGLSESRRIAEMAELYDTMISPHNWMSPLGTLINAQLCAAVSNVEILEIDLDDVRWKGDLLTHPLEIEDGQLVVSDRPGWGADIVEDVVRAHPLPADRLP
jgi:galactonate dehydratase